MYFCSFNVATLFTLVGTLLLQINVISQSRVYNVIAMSSLLALVVMHLHCEMHFAIRNMENMCTAGKLENLTPFIMITYDKMRLYAIR